MRIVSCSAMALSVLATLLLASACAGDEADTTATSTAPPPTESAVAQPEDAGAAMRLTLTDQGCTYLGDDSLESGSFTVEVENQTEYFGAFAVAGLAEGSTIGDLEAFVRQAQEQWDESETLPELPAFYTQAVRTGVEAGGSGLLPADVPAGTYVLMCFVDDLPTWRAYIAQQIEVAG
jgi:hypothetical protein